MHNLKKGYFIISAIAGGISISAGSIAIWLFSIKMWALAHHMITLMSGKNPQNKDKMLNMIYLGGLVLNGLDGLIWGLSQKYYSNQRF